MDGARTFLRHGEAGEEELGEVKEMVGRGSEHD